MDTPKNQQSTALSSAKKTPLKGLKNVLVQPYETSWPILKDEKKKSELYNMLTELLPRQMCSAKKMSWAKLCKLSKEERSALKKDAQEKHREENNDNMMATVILGINGVTKALEKNCLCSILIDSRIDPLFMVKHIVAMGQDKNIPVLMVPFLKTVTLNKIGFACAALGIKDLVSESKTEHFHVLHTKISDLVSMFRKVKSSVRSIVTAKEDMELPTNFVQGKSSQVSTGDGVYDLTQNTPVSKCVYKYRLSNKKRAFIPPELLPAAVEKEQMWTEYIALGNDDDGDDMTVMNETSRIRKRRYTDIHQSEDKLLESKKMSPNDSESDTIENMESESTVQCSVMEDNIQKTTYIPLKVKRIQGNPVRMKATKLAKMKKKDKMKK